MPSGDNMSPADAAKLTTPVGTADEDHIGSMADLVRYLCIPDSCPA
jgi:hypothetical protein